MSEKEFVNNKSVYELCKALGIIPPEMERVVRFVLTSEVNRMPIVEVWYYARREKGAPVEKKRYELTLIDEE